METDWIVDYRPDPSPVFTLMDEMYVEKGTKADYDELHHLHYKAEDTQVEIAAQYEVSHQVVSEIKRKEKWRHIHEE